MTVFCSASSGIDPVFNVAARRTGEVLAERGIELVYGGGAVGLMGETARACKAAGGRVTGVITQHLLDSEQGWTGCD
ncbi:MAG: TIGR00730 family Rossman fold protein, partial [Planctomycetota bacterium]|nr:TIGR00730 family Rossman fold protein [Planctomycetota bacterium]